MPKVFKEHLLTPPHLLEAPHNTSLLQETGQDLSEHDYYDPLKTYHEWKEISRPFKKRGKSYYTMVAILIVLFSPVALLLGGKLLFIAIIALGFAAYVFNMVPPEEITYKLSSQGVTIGDHFYHWQQLDSFWLSNKDGYRLLNILTQSYFPGMLMVVIKPEDEELIKNICARFLPFHEIVPKSQMEKWSESLQKHFPLENIHR